MRLALDSDILVYAEGVNGKDRQRSALALLERLDPVETVLPAQALGELFNVLVRKANRTRSVARQAVSSWQDTYPIAATSSRVISAAATLAADHELAIWDAVIVAAAASASCRLLLSEDMHDSFSWDCVTVTNPFADKQHPLLEALLKSST